MALSISTIPNFQYIGNPMPATLTENAANFRRFLYKIVVDSIETEEFEAKRNADNEALRDISSLFAQFFTKENYPLADVYLDAVALLVNQTTLAKAYTLEVRSQFTDSTPENTATAEGFALWGRLNYANHPANTFFTGAGSFQDTIKILSAKPTTSKTRLNQNEVWYMIKVRDTLTFLDSRLAYQVTLANGSLGAVQYINLGDWDLGKMMAIRVDYNQLIEPLSFANIPQKYAVWIECDNPSSPGFTRASEIRTMVIDQAYTPQMRQYYFRNRLGGMDTIVFKGETEEKMNAQRAEASRYLPPNYTLPSSSDFVDYVSDNLTYELNSGYLANYADYQLFMEFFRSDMIFEMQSNQLLPCKINTKSIPGYRDDKTEPYSCKLEIQYLFEN